MKSKEDFNKIKDMTALELRAKLNDYKEELFNLRFQLTTGHLDDYSRVGQVRKNIARVQTLIRENELTTAKSA